MKIHPTADVQTKKIGEDTTIWQYTVVLSGAEIGSNCNINAHCFIENDVVIKNSVTIKCGVYLWDGIYIEDFVQVGPNVTFTNDLYPRAKKSFKMARIHIEEGASIGAGCVIRGGVKLGRYSMIGAGSVVTKDIPPYTLWYGNPASLKGFITKDAKVVSLELKDSDGNIYELINHEPILKEKN